MAVDRCKKRVGFFCDGVREGNLEQPMSSCYLEVMHIDAIRSRILDARDDIIAEDVAHLSLFGSRVRGDARDDSDLDMLIVPAPNAAFSILNLIGVEHRVTELTGIKAHAVMERSLMPEYSAGIFEDLVNVF